MEVKFTVKELKSYDLIRTATDEYKPICTISCQNIIAFSRVIRRKDENQMKAPIFAVFLADVNTPYETNVIHESIYEVSDLVFNSDGKQLLIVNKQGHVYLFIKGSSLHEWDSIHTCVWPGETILCTKFFHLRNQPYINMNDLKVSAPYPEKFFSQSFQPTLTNIGACPKNGFFAVLASGIIICCTFDPTGSSKEESRASFGFPRERFDKAAAGLTVSGEICVSTWKANLIETWLVSIKYSSVDWKMQEIPKITTSVKFSECFQPYTNSIDKNIKCSLSVTHLSYSNYDNPNSLIVVLISEKGETNFDARVKAITENKKAEYDSARFSYIVQRYQRQEKSRPILNILQLPEVRRTTLTYKEWELQGEWVSNTRITALTMPIKQIVRSVQVPDILVVASKGGHIHTINKDTMLQTSKGCVFNLRPDDMPPPKRHADDKKIFSMCPTWSCLHLIALDSAGNLYMTSLLRQSDTGASWAVFVMLLLEYAIVSGCDWLDILMAMPPNSAFTLADRVSNTFHQHPPAFVQHLLVRFLVAKNAMLRLSLSLHHKSIESRLQVQLASIVQFFRLYRPVTAEAATSENDLFSYVQSFIESRNSLEIQDIDKAVDHLLYSYNILDYQVDPKLAYDMQSALQYATDMSLYLLLLLVQNPKYELIKDTKTLLYLREIFLVSRIWHRHKQFISPQVLKKSDSVDIWATIYRNLTKLSDILPSELDATFIDEIVTLETQVAYREMPLFIPPRGLIGCIAYSPTELPYPLQFNFDQADPNPNSSSVNPRRLEGSLNITKKFDHIRYQYLGTTESILQCTRCFHLRALPRDKTDYVPIWEQQWSSICVCGGSWAALKEGNASRLV